jgi:hypothetical protein
MSEFADFWRSFIPGWGSRIDILFMWTCGVFLVFIIAISIECFNFYFRGIRFS